MGKRLDRDEFIQSSGALHDYFIDNETEHGPYSAKVEVINKNSDKLVLRAQPTITVAYDNTDMRINIIWEDADYSREEFRGLGLYGYYDCTWVPMEYNDGVLVINSPDSDKIVKVYV